ncbi:MAG: Hsp20/alpha crystallin family protein [Acidimicrobiales bacterium]
MLLRFDPFRELDRTADKASRPPVGTLPFDAVRSDDEIRIRFDVPGVSLENVDLTVEKDTLTLTVDRSTDDEAEFLIRERRNGSVKRQLLLGETLDTEQLSASLSNGVLEVKLPVAEKAQARKVAIAQK